MRTVIIILSAVCIALLLIGCRTQTGSDIFDAVLDEIDHQADIIDDEWGWLWPDRAESEEEDYPEFEGEFEHTLRIFASQWESYQFNEIISLFRREHPEVNIQVETFSSPRTTSEEVALITQLLSGSYDIFMLSTISSEKLDVNSLFVDLNQLIDGSNGINREDYFDNVFRGMEANGILYSVPLSVTFEAPLPNIAYFRSAGINVNDLDTISWEQLLNIHQIVAARNPEHELFIIRNFNVLNVFDGVYDVATRRVDANTTEIRDLVVAASSIPTNIEFTPNGPQGHVVVTVSGMMDFLLEQRDNVLLLENHGFFLELYMMRDRNISNMIYGTPILQRNFNNRIEFHTSTVFSILQQSSNQDVAWDFVRFALENTLPLHVANEYHYPPSLYPDIFQPVNRERFRNSIFELLESIIIWDANAAWDSGLFNDLLPLHPSMNPWLDPEEAKEEYEEALLIWDEAWLEFQDVLQTLRDGMFERVYLQTVPVMELLDVENKRSFTVRNDFIYPDIYLYVTGRQSIDITLANIQNRLELYVWG
ncbi:MAG: hypothetical protein FWE83_06530 [Oscillospiraceae bacterium]|nr:hypothetical protein [Oscillospiraceae bacterium]